MATAAAAEDSILEACMMSMWSTWRLHQSTVDMRALPRSRHVATNVSTVFAHLKVARLQSSFLFGYHPKGLLTGDCCLCCPGCVMAWCK